MALQVAAGARHSVALLEGGGVLAWGYNGFAQLGLGDEEDRALPCEVRIREHIIAGAESGGRELSAAG